MTRGTETLEETTSAHPLGETHATGGAVTPGVTPEVTPGATQGATPGATPGATRETPGEVVTGSAGPHQVEAVVFLELEGLRLSPTTLPRMSSSCR